MERRVLAWDYLQTLQRPLATNLGKCPPLNLQAAEAEEEWARVKPGLKNRDQPKARWGFYLLAEPSSHNASLGLETSEMKAPYRAQERDSAVGLAGWQAKIPTIMGFHTKGTKPHLGMLFLGSSLSLARPPNR